MAYGQTREGLAERSGLSVDTIRRIEAGESSPSLDTLEKLCQGLGMSLQTLFCVLESGERNLVAEVCDLIAQRPPDEVHRLRRVFCALFENEAAAGEPD